MHEYFLPQKNWQYGELHGQIVEGDQLFSCQGSTFPQTSKDQYGASKFCNRNTCEWWLSDAKNKIIALFIPNLGQWAPIVTDDLGHSRLQLVRVVCSKYHPSQAAVPPDLSRVSKIWNIAIYNNKMKYRLLMSIFSPEGDQESRVYILIFPWGKISKLWTYKSRIFY